MSDTVNEIIKAYVASYIRSMIPKYMRHGGVPGAESRFYEPGDFGVLPEREPTEVRRMERLEKFWIEGDNNSFYY